jgi:hypothetical protein
MGGDMGSARADVADVARAFIEMGRPVMSREIRGYLKIPVADRAHLRTIIEGLMAAPAIGLAPLVAGVERKRNRYYVIKNEQILLSAINAALPPPAAERSKGTHCRCCIYGKVDSLDEKVTQLVSMWTT